MASDRSDEIALTGGNTAASVVRVGNTVRKPWLPSTESTIVFMDHLRERGIDLPVAHGRDEHGRLVLDYIPGELAMDRVPLDLPTIGRVGALVRAIHDASADIEVPESWEVLLPAEEPDMLCHNDLAPWNLVLDGDRLVFIDWDGAGPSTRSWDLAYAAIAFGHLFPDARTTHAAQRLVAFLDGYGADGRTRADLPAVLARRAGAMHAMLKRMREEGEEPWGSMFVDGHGAHWQATAAYLSSNEGTWRAAIG